MYNILIVVRSRLHELDTRHTWFQEPMKLEDAYGRVWPIPAEYDFFMVEGALRGKFRDGRGKALVERNQWQLFDSTNTQHVFYSHNWDPLPGMEITMAMIIPQQDDNFICPKLDCKSNEFKKALAGGQNW